MKQYLSVKEVLQDFTETALMLSKRLGDTNHPNDTQHTLADGVVGDKYDVLLDKYRQKFGDDQLTDKFSQIYRILNQCPIMVD